MCIMDGVIVFACYGLLCAIGFGLSYVIERIEDITEERKEEENE